ncbi:hypothetical protein GB931_14260 [Modestobacter sp. I12A-02628]|uniref:Uncharacterized protein n=1 Tax=Goekera deserti TaxID=2497753 RepID=A0A7K3WHG7_9ACTN|nr:hypothetical protein [Goekera deserti]MPQ99064.1 hypothetical protein [Goekera deserti]NDI47398.1 hypothetical protein [Goekera deserti]NEL55928.1 hypothetical protein [Goekera deserti]
MTSTLTAPTTTATARPHVRTTGVPLTALTALEVRKSLSTRSGKLVAIAATLVAPAAITVVLLAGEEAGRAVEMIAVLGSLGALVLLALGVLSTAGEWTHRTVQTTFLTVPRRGRVVTAKVVAAAGLGAVLTAVGVGVACALLALGGDGVTWDGTARAAAVLVAGGAAFTVVGAGIGAALTNAPAALTGAYLVVLGVFPVLLTARPEIGEKLDPTTSLVLLAAGPATATPVLVLTGWVLLSVVAGTLVTLRRAVA